MLNSYQKSKTAFFNYKGDWIKIFEIHPRLKLKYSNLNKKSIFELVPSIKIMAYLIRHQSANTLISLIALQPSSSQYEA